MLLVIATSAAHRAFPPRLTILGAAVAIGGLFLVLDLTGSSDLDPLGIAFALTAAVAVAGYFHLAGHVAADSLPPVALASGGLLTGAAILAATATTVMGFAAFMVADNGGLRGIGKLAVLGISIAAITAILVLPALAAVFTRRR